MNGKICVKCQVELRVAKTGVWVVAMTTHREEALWRADLWVCRGCGTKVVLGMGCAPVATTLHENWKAIREAAEGSGDRIYRVWLNHREKWIYEERTRHEGNNETKQGL